MLRGSQTIHFGIGSYININSVDVRSAALGVDSATVSIAGTDGTAAQSALTLISTAIERKDSARASFGYICDEPSGKTDEVLNIQAENLMSAESRISDVDVATEMAALTRNQVLAQAGIRCWLRPTRCRRWP